MDIQDFYSKLDVFFQQKDLSKTMEFLERNLKTAEKSEDPAALVAVYNELGGVCRVSGQTERAKVLYKKVISILNRMNLKDTEHYATALINAGDVYLMTGEFEPALGLFLDAQEMLKALGLDNDYRMAALSNNISSVYSGTGKYDEAEKALDRAFFIIKQIPQCKSELATTYVSLGELNIKQGKLGTAERNFRNAVQIFEEDNGNRDVHYSAALAGLGQVCYLDHKYEHAEKYFSNALELIERDFGKNATAYNTVLHSLETVRKQRGQNIDEYK